MGCVRSKQLCSRIPDIAFASKMREKSEGWVMGVDILDPSKYSGVIEVMKNQLKCVPVVSQCGNVRRAQPVFGIAML